jgi:hypothetical protein
MFLSNKFVSTSPYLILRQSVFLLCFLIINRPNRVIRLGIIIVHRDDSSEAELLPPRPRAAASPARNCRRRLTHGSPPPPHPRGPRATAASPACRRRCLARRAHLTRSRPRAAAERPRQRDGEAAADGAREEDGQQGPRLEPWRRLAAHRGRRKREERREGYGEEDKKEEGRGK